MDSREWRESLREDSPVSGIIQNGLVNPNHMSSSDTALSFADVESPLHIRRKQQEWLDAADQRNDNWPPRAEFHGDDLGLVRRAASWVVEDVLGVPNIEEYYDNSKRQV